MLTDDELLDFDRKQLAHPADDERQLLAEHGDVYRAQLVAARWVEQWADSMKTGGKHMAASDEYMSGFDSALRDITAHLRQGDFLPGSQPYEQEMGGEVIR